jgi:lysophospholipase L1-like esterase
MPVSRLLVRLLAVTLSLILLGLALYGATRAYKRLWFRIPFVQNENWNTALAGRKLLISSQLWLDTRPLVIFAGDSHIESGDWYQWLQGARAVRNCGMATARIEHVTELVASLREPKIDTFLLHCGINNLGRGDSPADCLVHYTRLLDQAAALNPGHIIVVAVMPLRQSPVDPKSKEVNARVREFNTLLAELCQSRGIALLDLKEIIADTNGGLKDEFTNDGLHLNLRGYATITPRIFDILTSDP